MGKNTLQKIFWGFSALISPTLSQITLVRTLHATAVSGRVEQTSTIGAEIRRHGWAASCSCLLWGRVWDRSFLEREADAIIRARGLRRRGAEVYHLRDGNAEGVAEGTQEGKKLKTKPFSFFGGGPKEEDGRDEEQQVVLDVEGFGKDAETFGVDVQGSL